MAPQRCAPGAVVARAVVGGGLPPVCRDLQALGLPVVATATAFVELRRDILNAERYIVFDDVVPALEAGGGWRLAQPIVSNHVPELETPAGDPGCAILRVDRRVRRDQLRKPHPRLPSASAGPEMIVPSG